jgi:hypothetical protein
MSFCSVQNPFGPVAAIDTKICFTGRIYRQEASATNGAAAAARDEEKQTKYGVGTHRAPLGFTPPTTETYGRMGAPAHAFLQRLALWRPPRHQPGRG